MKNNSINNIIKINMHYKYKLDLGHIIASIILTC